MASISGNPNTSPAHHHDHHGGLDGAAVGGLVGKEGEHGHTTRDAALGGVAGHELEAHREHRHEEASGYTNPAPATNVGGGGGGASGMRTAGMGASGGIHKPTVTDKVIGTVDQMVGKIVHNPSQQEHGEVRKKMGKEAAANVHPNPASRDAHAAAGGTTGGY